MDKKKGSLDQQIATTSLKGRRSFVKSLGAIGFGTAAILLGSKTAHAQDRTDHDVADNSDTSPSDGLPDRKVRDND